MNDNSDIETRLEKVKKTLMRDKDFAAAKTELLKDWNKQAPHVKLTQQLAVCTYKNPESAPAERYQDALRYLQSIRKIKDGQGETLRLMGAVYKRKWAHDGRLENLHYAYGLYRQAADNDPQEDRGYGAVNAAYILDLLASRAQVRAKKTRTKSKEAQSLRRQAKTLRENTLKIMDGMMSQDETLASDIWFLPTLAELHYGLGITGPTHYDKARQFLTQTVKMSKDSWEMETSFRQFVGIAKAQGIALPPRDQKEDEWEPAWKVLTAYLKNHPRAALECYRGKVGLALSGGGFRASFYHLGVLARLAEMDVLRSVEVLSTVSGGSIVGAHYYLEVQKLLEQKHDADITKADYVGIVRRVQKQFFSGVSKNLRMRTFVNAVDNIRMLFDEKFSRSHRIGSLYQRDLYSNIGNDKPCQDCTALNRDMSDLMITPKSDEEREQSFQPNRDNWKRSARVPVLLLNTTTLNSGHNWRFTAKWMGEPPGVRGEKVDKNCNYQWVDYGEEIGHGLKAPQVPLGNAVAASACVPGLFEPLEIADLYPGHTVKLVDGGVHDNQGVAALLDQACTLILCSDASGQMNDISEPGSSTLGVPLRSNEIMMDRIRETQYQDLAARVDSRALQGLFFTHLKDDLDVGRIKPGAGNENRCEQDQQETEYAIHPEIQRRIAALRTDLDCFSEVEAHALMLSGYKMTVWHCNELQKEHEHSGEAGQWGDFDIRAEAENWDFLDADFEQILERAPSSDNPASADLARQLDIGSSLFLKVFKAVPWLKKAGLTVVAVLLLLLVYLVYQSWGNSLFEMTVGKFTLFVLFFLATLLWPAFKWLNPQSQLQNKLWLGFVGIVGAGISWIHVNWLDPLFLQAGEVRRLKKLSKSNR